MERRPRKLAVGLCIIILIAISVIRFRLDEMTTRHSLAIERLLESRNAAARAEQFALRTAS
jgi:hypothetical protein